MTQFDESFSVEKKPKDEQDSSDTEVRSESAGGKQIRKRQNRDVVMSDQKSSIALDHDSAKISDDRMNGQVQEKYKEEKEGVIAEQQNEEHSGRIDIKEGEGIKDSDGLSEQKQKPRDQKIHDRYQGKRSHQQQNQHRIVREKKPIVEMNLQELVHHARRVGILGAGLMSKQDLLEKIQYIEAHPELEIEVEGVLEKLPDGFGFLRSAQYDYTSSPDDVYVSPSQIRRFGLRNGDIVRGIIRKLREEERYFALLKVIQVNNEDPMKLSDRPHFDNLVPVYPHEKFMLEFDTTAIATRIMDLFTPIGKGQRGLIVAPPKVGKTMLLKELARAIMANHPDTYLMVLHIDERPEEVADMKRTVHGGRAEVISSTFDETADRHVQVAELALEKAKRLVECGYDVVIVLDSITRLARAYNTIAPASGKVLTGGIDANALQRPKRFFGAARCVEGKPGSLTIIASALIETGSKMDEVIFEEFKGTGNMEMNMTRKLSNRRIFPAFDLLVSGTRRDDLLLPEETLNKVWVLQKLLATMNTLEGMELLIDKIKKTKMNEEFLDAMKRGGLNGSSSGNP